MDREAVTRQRKSRYLLGFFDDVNLCRRGTRELAALDKIRTLYHAHDPELLRTLAIIRDLERKHSDQKDIPKAS